MNKEAIIINDKISIGISACCMGCPVRYNGKGFDMLKFLGREKGDYRWCPVCPECTAGLGVPREAIHLSGGDGAMVWHGEAKVKNRLGLDVTENLKKSALIAMETLKSAGAIAYIYMDGSPTCGVYRTTLKKQKRGNPPGIFGNLLLENGFFLIPSTDLQSPLKWWDWRRRLLAFYWLKDLNLYTKDEIYETWYRLKFLCQEIDQAWARDMGRKLAALDNHNQASFIQAFKQEIMDTLRKPSTTRRITNSLWKNYSYYRKTKGKIIDGIYPPEINRNMSTIAKELLLMERSAVSDKILFGPSPVIYRTKSSKS